MMLNNSSHEIEMTIQNKNLRFGMVIGPFANRPGRAIRAAIRQRIPQTDPLLRIREQRFDQNQTITTYFFVSGEKDCFEFRHGKSQLENSNPLTSEDGDILLEELLNRAIKPDTYFNH